MKKDITLVFAGGDLRSVAAARRFSEQVGRVLLTGFDRYEGDCGNAVLTHLPEQAIPEADALILPLPYTVGGGILNAPYAEKHILLDSVFHLAEHAKAVCGGMLPPMEERFHDYYDEPMMLRNADVTAEAALLLAGERISGCLNGASVVLVGYGRIGKRLAAKAHALGCRVTVAARKESDHALIWMCGHSAIGFDALPEALQNADVVFNTVPAEIFTEETLSRIPRNAPLIDLANSVTGDRVIRASGLPGKYAPEAAGQILKESVEHILRKGGIL